MKNSTTPMIIAVPTHELKYEIFRRADSMGLQDICCTPYLNDFSFSDEIQEDISHLYQIGAGEYVLKFLAGKLKRIKPNEADYLQISEYLKQQKRASRFSGHIITTHANLLHMSQEILSSHTVIIDEDIFRTLLNTSSINTEELLELERSNILTAEEQSKLRFFHYHYNYQKVKPINVLQSEDKIRKIQNLDVNICGLMRAEYAYISKTQIHFIEEQKLPDCKVIVLSATVDPELYRMLYPERNIDFYACQKARYKGKILQYTDSSYSRYVLTNHDFVMDKVKRSTADETVITFQEIEKELGTRYHFGSIEGLDHLAGQPLSIVGLPNLHEIVYCLYGMRLGSELKKQKMFTHRIEYDGYSFSLNTYSDKILQRIQIWMLSSQLEQAVGRARLLRNNNTVTVFAGFPVEQAEYIWK